MIKNNIKKGLYPISLTDVKRYIKNANGWGYGNKDTCKYVAECVIDKLSIDYPELTIKETLYSDLISITHDINNGSLMKKVEINLVD